MIEEQISFQEQKVQRLEFEHAAHHPRSRTHLDSSGNPYFFIN